MGLPVKCEISLYHKYEKGARNLITDVEGVTVGQVTLHDETRDIHTGVTVVRPHRGNLFREKVPAGAAVLNGFGKTAGLVQVEELGTIETPVVLTNTLSVGTALTALTRYMLEENPEIGVTTGTVNGVVAECNDGSLSDIRGLYVTEAHVRQALEHCAEQFEEGAVGSGSGMCCMGLKGGIGSASRLLAFGQESYTVGALVMSNFGVRGNLRVDGIRMPETAKPPVCPEQDTEKAEEQNSCPEQASGKQEGAVSCPEQAQGKQEGSASCLEQALGKPEEPSSCLEQASEKPENPPVCSDRNTGESPEISGRPEIIAEHGSVIIVLATDLPLSDRQLRRMARRSAAALGRTGSYMGNGSGDIAIAFSTANRIPHNSREAVYTVKAFRDDAMDPVFEATVEAVEEAVISSLYHAGTTKGIRGKLVYGLREYL